MKRVFVVTVGFVVLSAMSLMASAQVRPGTAAPARPAAPQPTPAPATVAVPATKIALIDTTAFSDEKTGIKRYLNAVNGLRRQFEARNTELRNLDAQIKALAAEINKLSAAPVVSQETIRAKQDEGTRLERDLKYKKEQADADYAKKYEEVVGPVSADIGKALDLYASQYGLTMVLDVSKLLPAILTVNPTTDITEAFIADYNSKNP